jgi:NAD(P)-dependent dehydrogenase (short-subunit alcohol dehydrogenase family)
VAANNRFDGMPAVITGGASGIGLAVASRIIAEGGQVTLWDVDQAKTRRKPSSAPKPARNTSTSRTLRR